MSLPVTVWSAINLYFLVAVLLFGKIRYISAFCHPLVLFFCCLTDDIDFKSYMSIYVCVYVFLYVYTNIIYIKSSLSRVVARLHRFQLIENPPKFEHSISQKYLAILYLNISVNFHSPEADGVSPGLSYLKSYIYFLKIKVFQMKVMFLSKYRLKLAGAWKKQQLFVYRSRKNIWIFQKYNCTCTFVSLIHKCCSLKPERVIHCKAWQTKKEAECDAVIQSGKLHYCRRDEKCVFDIFQCKI